MARILIAYASKTGTAKNCAALLQKELTGLDVTLSDLEKESPSPKDYDVAVIGSSIRFGKIRGAVTEYLKKHEDVLQKMPHGFFLCCGFGHEFDEYARKQISVDLRESAFATINFGGLLRLENASFLEKLFLRKVRTMIRESELEDGEYTPELPNILPENVRRLATALRANL